MAAVTLTDLGTGAAACLAILSLIAFVVKSKPWRRFVVAPFAGFFREQVSHVTEPQYAELRAQLMPNGGQSLRDRVDILEAGQESIADQVQAVEDRLERWEKQ